METLHLELYIIGQSARSQAAVANLDRVCRGLPVGRCRVTIVDVLEHPEAAETANIVATPTLIRRQPAPVRRLVGDLSATEKVLRGLGIDPEPDVRPGEGVASDG
jgi:circadian clock protein KaiB